jgi:hypothetical protein
MWYGGFRMEKYTSINGKCKNESKSGHSPEGLFEKTKPMLK